MSSIVSLFPGTPRPQQEYVLNEVERSWHTSDIFVIQAPVSTGKSNLAYTIAKFAGQGAILTPNNLLVQQYQRDFTDLPVLNKKDSYRCERDKRSCVATKAKCGKFCDNCPLMSATKDFYDAPIYVANYYTYLAHKQWRETLIVDEAHNLLKMLTEDAAKRVWKHKDHYPPEVQTYADVLAFLETRGPKYKKLLAQLKRDRQRSLCQRAWEYYRGEAKECLKFVPIDAREQPPILWNPHKVKKIVLLSATINHNDIYDLGLDRRRVCYISTDSPINPSRRPVVYSPVGSVSYKTQAQTLPRIAEKILEYAADNEHTKGVVHMTYGMSTQLKEWFAQNNVDTSRFLFHTSATKASVYRTFTNTKDPKVLIACGMTEGIDLPGDLGRWQIVTKVPFLSLGDPAIDHKRQQRPEWYAWQAVLAVLQASGRICRGPLDYGVTYILDSNWGQLMKRYPNLVPKWFKEAYKELTSESYT